MVNRANSFRQVDHSPTATPSMLWPPTPSPTTASVTGDANIAPPFGAFGVVNGLHPFGQFGTMDAGMSHQQAAPFGTDIALFTSMHSMTAPSAHPPEFFQAAASMMAEFPVAPQMAASFAAPAPAAPVAHAPPQVAAPTLQLSDMLTPASQVAEAPARSEAQPSGADACLGTVVGPRPSLGSTTHNGRGDCRPCAWYYKPKGCQMGSQCDFCHLCPEGELKNRKKAKVAAIRQRTSR